MRRSVFYIMFLSPNSAKQELRIGNLPVALCCTLADTEVCMPTGVHGNISQFWFVLSVPTHHKYCAIPDSISVNPCHVAATISDLFWYWRSQIPTMRTRTWYQQINFYLIANLVEFM